MQSEILERRSLSTVQKTFKGVWIIPNEHERPDVVVYYCHGKWVFEPDNQSTLTLF